MPVTIGVDAHKKTHTMVALDGVGRRLGEKTVPTTTDGHLAAVQWASQWTAEGETIRLFVIRGTKAQGNKRLVQIREQVVPEGGDMTFKKADRNGKRKTRYIAKISVDGTTYKSNTQKIR